MTTLDGAELLRLIGCAKGVSGDADEERDAFEEARKIHEEIGSLEMIGAAKLLVNIGEAQAKAGDEEGSTQTFSQAHRIMSEHRSFASQATSADVLRTVDI